MARGGLCESYSLDAPTREQWWVATVVAARLASTAVLRMALVLAGTRGAGWRTAGAAALVMVRVLVVAALLWRFVRCDSTRTASVVLWLGVAQRVGLEVALHMLVGLLVWLP